NGGALGPPLDQVGLRRSLKFLRDSLLNPSAYIPREWDSSVVVTKSGESYTGVRLNEDEYSIQLRDATNRNRSLWKSELREWRRLGRSLMPEYTGLPDRDLEDLLAYLSSLRKAS